MPAGLWLAAHPYVQTVLNDGPILYWPLGEKTGSSAADISGHARTGTYTGGFTLGAAGAMTTASDTGVDLNGSNAAVTTTYNPFANGTSITLEAWINRDTQGTRDDTIMGALGSAGVPGLYIESHANASVYWIPDSASQVSFGLWPLAYHDKQGAWHHIVLTFNESSNVAELFIDGVSQSTKTVTDQYPAASITGFEVGAWFSTSTANFDGKIDEVALYEYVLSTTRISAHYTAGTT